VQALASLLRPPHFEDERVNNQASMLYAILLVLPVFIVIYMFIAPIFFYPGSTNIYLVSLLEVVTVLGMLLLVRRGHVRLASWLLCGAIEALLLYTLTQTGGVEGSGYFSQVILILLVGLLLGGRMAVVAAGVSMVAGLAAWCATQIGLAPHEGFEPSRLAVWFEVTLNLISVAVFLLVWDHNTTQARARTDHELAERRRAEAALAKSKEQLRLALSASRVGTWNWDMATDEVVWSREVSELFGLDPDEPVGTFERYLGLLHPEDRPHVEATIRRAVADHRPMQVEHRVIWPDGSVHWLAGRGEVAVNDVGQPVRMAGTVLDITEQKETAEELIASEQKYRILFETAQDAIISLERDSRRIVDCNPATEKMYGYSREELLRMDSAPFALDPQCTLDEIPDGDPSPRVQLHRRSAIHRRKDGSQFPVEISASAYEFRGKPMIYAAWRDITERVRAEEEVRSSEARYRAIVESTGDLICRFLPDTTLTFVNEAYCRYFGRSRQELIGAPFLDLIPTTDRQNVLDQIDRLVRDKKTHTYEHQVMKPNGDITWQRWSDQPILDEDGNFLELQSVGRDVTEERIAQQKIQESLQEKEVLLREIHHRVKNNLQIVSSLLKLQAAHLDDSQARATFADSHSRINSMALIHERLYRSGDLARVDFAAYTHDLMIHLFRSYGATRRGIVHQIDIPNLQLRVDNAIPCGLIINELVTNALKHAFPGQQEGQVTIRMACDEEGYRLTVQDDGVGLPPGLDIGQTDSLGLQLVHTLTAQLDGSLTLLAGPGAGFCLTFPNH